MNATVTNKRYHLLEIPTTENAPMLLLEWLADTLTPVSVIRKSKNEDGEDVFEVHMIATRGEIQDCAYYINQNS
jgi:hypothetical protein